MAFGGAPMWTSALTLAILIEVHHVLSSNSVTYQILEQLEPGTVIGNIVADAKLSDDFTPEELDQLRFTLLPRDHDDLAASRYFAVDPTTGTIRISAVIDRDSEELCAYQKSCHVTFDVAIHPAPFFRMIDVQIEILDKNDNAPVFTRSEYRLNISETALPTTTYTLPSVFDLDSTDFGIKNIELRPNTEYFQVIWSQDMKGHVQPKLRLLKQLDREVAPVFDLTVVAYDSDTPLHSAQLAVHVTVLDTNDNSPVFDLPKYEARIQENTRIGAPIISIHATDPDAGKGGTVRYSLNSQTLGEAVTKFEIDPVSGRIYLAATVDRETKDVYDMQVIAKDQAKDHRQASVPLTIYIDDVNDNAPDIQISVITSSGRAEVSESAALGTFVALLSVTDQDWGQNAEVTCHLSSSKFGMLVMQPNSKFKIVTQARLDREQQDEYPVSVYCQDKGIPTLSSSETFSVYVTDVNDHEPVFTKKQYVGSVEENSRAGVQVVQVEATDEDVGDNARLSYRLIDDYGSRFQIDPDTGVIRTRATFDYERSPEIQLRVEARDHGNPPLSSTCDVTIKVIDVNDMAPEFSDARYTFSVRENQLTDTFIGRVSATDRDTGSNKRFVFSLKSEDQDLLSYFSISPDDGSLKLLKPLDREQRPFYYLTVVARDTEPPRLSSSTTVTVYVEDVNDNAPIVDFPNPHNNTAVISNRLPPGYKVTQIRAHDPDEGDNAELSYFIVHEDADDNADGDIGAQRFGVDPKSGEIFLNYDLSNFKTATFHVSVLVKDAGTPEQSTFANLTVQVNQSVAVYSESTGYSSTDSKNSKNMLIIIIVVAISGVIIIVLLASIVFVLLTSRKKRASESAATASIVMDTIDAANNSGNGQNGNKTAYNKAPAKQINTSHNDISVQIAKEHQRYVTLSNQSSLNMSNNAASIDRRTGNIPPVPPRGVLMNYMSDEQKPDIVPVSANQPVGSPRRSAEEIDRQSAASSEDSITDSGRGASEEGENGEERGPPRLPPKQPLLSNTRRQPLLSKLAHTYGSPRRADNTLSLDRYLQPGNTSSFVPYQSRTSSPHASTTSLHVKRPNPRLTELLLKPDFGLSQIQNEFDPHYRLKYRDLYTAPNSDGPRGDDVTVPCLSSFGDVGGDSGVPRHEDGCSTFGGQGSYPQNKQTVRSVKAKDKCKKVEFGSSSLLNGCQPVTSASAGSLAGNGYGDANSALRYNSIGGSTCSDLTDGTSLTSATSGSYIVQHDDDGDVRAFSRNTVPVSSC